MNEIIKLLKSNLFWTIIGVLAAAGGLWYVLSDSHKKATLGIGTAQYSVKDMDKDEAYVLVNILAFDEEKPHPVLAPIVLSPVNFGNESVNNVGLRFYYTPDGKDTNWTVRNTVVDKPYQLSLLYMRNGDKADAIESGAGFSIPTIDPQVASGTDYNNSGVFTPIIFDSFNPEDLWKQEYKVEVKGDNSSTSEYNVVVLNYPLQVTSDEKLYEKRIKDILNHAYAVVDQVNGANINIVYCPVTYTADVVIDDLRYFVGLPSINDIKSQVRNK